MAIKQKEVIISMLQKMYWVETEMEQLGTWEARIEMMGECTNTLEILQNDSDVHRIILEKWMNVIKIEIPKCVPTGLPSKGFNFSGMDAPGMFKELMKYEVFARDVYAEITNADQNVLGELLPDETERREFISDLENVIKDEIKHVSLCKKMVGGYTTIMSGGN
ncbi:MAG: hypothetical protein P1P69_07870 [Methanosarcinaceae archaeon]|nr:hypothetical protein [Methanosarcinaceae archaeon]